MTKKILAIICSLCLAVSVASCGKEEPASGTPETNINTQSGDTKTGAAVTAEEETEPKTQTDAEPTAADEPETETEADAGTEE